MTQRAEIAGFQRGNQVILSWKMPARNAPTGNVQNISRIDVYRLAEPANSPLQLSEEEFAARSTIITTIPVTNADFALKTLQYKDTLQFAGQPARLRYAVRYVNAAGQKAAFSNSLLIEPTSKVASIPSDLEITTTQTALKLNWQPPTQNIDGTSPVSIQGYNVYRSTSKTEPAKLLTATPISDAEYTDEFFEFEKQYYYFIRAVSLGTQTEPVESGESNIVEIKPVDTFAPAAPESITIAAAPGTISIFFVAPLDTDVEGYKIYRTTDPATDKADWELITPDLLKTNTFQDKRVESGKRYHYYITATDKFKNVSEPSEVVSEIAP
ncbi:MAG: fibronectin type III domain-containing protein [Pyrinomonadaceae bacterium]